MLFLVVKEFSKWLQLNKVRAKKERGSHFFWPTLYSVCQYLTALKHCKVIYELKPESMS